MRFGKKHDHLKINIIIKRLYDHVIGSVWNVSAIAFVDIVAEECILVDCITSPLDAENALFLILHCSSIVTPSGVTATVHTISV